ncbi:MAG: 5-formyltetrahydrofolate cyclo-ligase [bacterium]
MMHRHAELTTADLTVAKAVMRRALAVRSAAVSASEQACASVAGADWLATWAPLRQAKRVALYAALPGELALTSLFQVCGAMGKALAFPRYCSDHGAYELAAVDEVDRQTQFGRFGVREPLPERPALTDDERCAPDLLWLVPGIAFDRHGRRLGRGGGFYDRLLAGARGLRVGVAFSWRLVPVVPTAAFDQPMDWLATEAGGFSCLRLSSPTLKVT